MFTRSKKRNLDDKNDDNNSKKTKGGLTNTLLNFKEKLRSRKKKTNSNDSENNNPIPSTSTGITRSVPEHHENFPYSPLVSPTASEIDNVDVPDGMVEADNAVKNYFKNDHVVYEDDKIKAIFSKRDFAKPNAWAIGSHNFVIKFIRKNSSEHPLLESLMSAFEKAIENMLKYLQEAYKDFKRTQLFLASKKHFK